MNIEDYIIEQANKILSTSNCEIVKRLEGGMSNYTYLIKNGNDRYTYRVPGKSAEKFVERSIEKANIEKIERLGLNNKTIFLDVITGDKMAGYVEGTIISDADVSSFDAEAAATLKKLHSSGITMNDYDPFGRLSSYEQFCIDLGFKHDDSYAGLRHGLESLRDRYDKGEKVACHCDFQPSNLVHTAARLYVLDWEYAGMNDPFYDIACYGNAGIDKALSLLACYVGHTPTDEELKRLYFWRSFQCLQWYNVATFKELIGLGKELNLDFMAIADTFSKMAKQLLELTASDTIPSNTEEFSIYGKKRQ